MLALIIFSLVLLVVVLICGVTILSDTSSDGSEVTTVPSTSAPQNNTTAEPDTTLSPDTTLTPDTTPSPETTTAPATTPAPETTPTPETTVPTVYPLLSGSFSSNYDIKLKLVVDWRTVSRSATEAEIEFAVSLTSYKLGVGVRNNNYINIGGKSYRFSTEKINVTESVKTSTPLAVMTVKVPLTDGKGSFDASCSWQFNGTYSGVKLIDMIAETVIEIK
jgi:hypothetical protein